MDPTWIFTTFFERCLAPPNSMKIDDEHKKLKGGNAKPYP